MTKAIFQGQIWEVPNYSTSDIKNMRASSPFKQVKIICGATQKNVYVSDIRSMSPFGVGFKDFGPIDFTNVNHSHSRANKTKISKKPSSAKKNLVKKNNGNDSIKVCLDDENEIYTLNMSIDSFNKADPRTKVIIHRFFSKKKVRISKLSLVSD